MVSTVVNVAFGNSENVLTFAAYPVARLSAYSKSAESKLKEKDGSNNSSDHSDTAATNTIFFETAKGIVPVPSGMQVVLRFMNLPEHPPNGYPASYRGHKRLTVKLANQIAGRAVPFVGLVRIHEALLLLDPKNHLGRQFDIRKAVLDHINTTVLTPDELYKIGKIFSHSTTLDDKLINHAVNKTLDFMGNGIENDATSQAAFDALLKVCNAVPALDEKMTKAHLGKAARMEREEAKAVRNAEYHSKRAIRGQGRTVRESAPRSAEFKKEKLWEELEQATDGHRTLSTELVNGLMCGPVTIKTVKVL